MVFITKSYQDLFGVRSYINAFHIPLLTIKDVLNGVLIARKNMRPVGSPPLP